MEDDDFTVEDVHEHAALIGKDIEAIVTEHGGKVIENIMPKIVICLEQLESLAKRCESYEQRIHELVMDRERLVIQTVRDEALKRQLQEKLGYTEGLLSKDKQDLQVKIKTLNEENVTLNDELAERENDLEKLKSTGALPEDVEKMKSMIDEQKEEIRILCDQIDTQNEELGAVEFLNSIIVDLKKNNNEQQKRIDILSYGDDITEDGHLGVSSTHGVMRQYCDICDAFDTHDTIDCPQQSKTSDVTKYFLNPRMRTFCDVCDVFDLHDTEECPHACPDESPGGSQHHGKRHEDRPYCEVCERFGHNTETCDAQDER